MICDIPCCCSFVPLCTFSKLYDPLPSVPATDASARGARALGDAFGQRMPDLERWIEEHKLVPLLLDGGGAAGRALSRQALALPLC